MDFITLKKGEIKNLSLFYRDHTCSCSPDLFLYVFVVTDEVFTRMQGYDIHIFLSFFTAPFDYKFLILSW